MDIAVLLHQIARLQVDSLLNWKGRHIGDQEARQGENKIPNRMTWIV